MQQIDYDPGATAARRLALDPGRFFAGSCTKMQSVPWDELSALHLEALQFRFEQLRDAIPTLTKLADRQRIDRIRRLNDVVPLLFEHTMYKSYPATLLAQNRFDHLTRWLDKLTSHDLSAVDTRGCEGLDDWMDALDRQTELVTYHSSGSSGTVSFIPRGKAEFDRYIRNMKIDLFQRFGSDEVAPEGPLNVHVIYPFFRHGAYGHVRSNDYWMKHFAGCEERFHALYPERMSSDVMYVAARMRAAGARGELDRLEISPRMRGRMQEFRHLQQAMPQHLQRFVEEELKSFAGERILTQGTWIIHWDMAQIGLAKGMRKMYAPDSVILSGGGNKGREVPPNWRDPIREFIGAERIHAMYGMSEVLGSHMLCPYDKYHLAAHVIPFVLDPDSSAPLAREGRVTGRAAFYDLSVDALWGGFITGDEVTMNWNGGCPCGRSTPFYDFEIQRFSEKRGGDDKISCAASVDAHAEALAFLSDFNR